MKSRGSIMLPLEVLDRIPGIVYPLYGGENRTEIIGLDFFPLENGTRHFGKVTIEVSGIPDDVEHREDVYGVPGVVVTALDVANHPALSNILAKRRRFAGIVAKKTRLSAFIQRRYDIDVDPLGRIGIEHSDQSSVCPSALQETTPQPCTRTGSFATSKPNGSKHGDSTAPESTATTA